ncbi:methyltransferase [Massilia sp. Root418]|uniref:CheR family methyltransferase n=1 Tax=Massilia sp. Root418 TaxID=1736532 RepID=UPI0006F5DF8B|nr:protein-glutamate O-methyltransferase CheR [Massilia sp. Root418]KQW94051.1 methyltransferase [Massilia sp. Root418]
MTARAMLRRATGLTVSKSAADRAVRERMEITGETDREHYLAALTPAELGELVELVVVPESWLFRDPQAFQVAVQFVQERLARQAAGAPARPVRILSVPCAGGEEPYSMAMALCDAGVPDSAFTIDAYDLSAACVARARRGVYGRNAFRAQDLAFRERYFSSAGNEDYLISDAIRAQVRFSQGNLLELDARGRRYDIIFCRNLLIYFDKPTTKAAIERLAALLADDGILFAGYAEVPSIAHHGFTPLPHRQAFGLKKDTAQEVPPALPVPPIPPRPLSRQRPAAGAAAQPFNAGQRTPASAPAPGPSAAPARNAAPGTRLKAAAAAVKTATAAPSAAELLVRARQLADRGQSKEAAEACRDVLAAAPETAGAYFILGMLSDHAGQPAQAEEHWRRCVYLQPDHYEALCHLALLAEQSGNSSGAAAFKARAARIYQRQQNNRTVRAES